MSVLWFTASDYLLSIFKLSLQNSILPFIQMNGRKYARFSQAFLIIVSEGILLQNSKVQVDDTCQMLIEQINRDRRITLLTICYGVAK